MIVRLIGELFEISLGADDQARTSFHPNRVDGLHRGREILHVIAAHQILRHERASEIHDHLIAFLPNVHRGPRIGELHDNSARAVRTASEVDGSDSAARRTRRLPGACVSRFILGQRVARLVAEGDDNVVAVDL